MLNLISKGDVDFGLIKRYVADTKADFAELPVVYKGSTVFVIEDNEVYEIDEAGEWKLKISYGAGGETGGAVPGYILTEADKEEIADAVFKMTPVLPTYDPVMGNFYANGIGVTIEDAGDGENLIATYNLDTDGVGTLIFPQNSRVLGGGDGSVKTANYPSTFVVVNSGIVRSVSGGSFGKGNVGTATIIFNGGEAKEGIGGGGVNNRQNDEATGNTVGHTEVYFNGGKTLTLYGGATTGMGRVGSTNVQINGGEAQWVTVGGSNGYTGVGVVDINGGNVIVAQTVNRGEIEQATINIKGGLVSRVYGGGEKEDASVNGKCKRSILNILGGQTEVRKGTFGGIENVDRVTGTYAPAAVTNPEVCEEIGLRAVETLNTLAQKMIWQDGVE